MNKILLVEDNSQFREGANKYFNSRKDVELVYALNYDEAVKGLYAEPKIDGAVIDCFFPKKTGSGDISLGKEIVKKMESSDPDEKKRLEGLKVLGEYINLNDQDMRKYARHLINNTPEDDILQNPIVKAIKQVSMLGKDVATIIVKDTLGMTYQKNNLSKDYYDALRNAMEKSETNQPLGISIADKANELGIPFILATSTNHHDILTQPIQDYVSRKGWGLVDCFQNRENEKATPEFWEKAFNELERKLK
jgi:DNA-binding NarL/FixJ family response regulator|tara:strand:- start:1509 stop:2258 length:750 start_codon:yes stop_codon:yes gene_type:complete